MAQINMGVFVMEEKIERETFKGEREPRVKQSLEEQKFLKEKKRDIDYRYECDSGVCFESGI